MKTITIFSYIMAAMLSLLFASEVFLGTHDWGMMACSIGFLMFGNQLSLKIKVITKILVKEDK